ncbi:MAG: NAD-binding protein [Actinomycetota bacterium]|nr:NAD-binding protein [Actinomycetota bacterium]
MVKALVSGEFDDAVGQEILGLTPQIEVIGYDPNETVLTEEQSVAEVLVAPYRNSRRPIRLVPILPRLRMVQLLSAGTDDWVGHVPTHVALAGARGAHAGPVSEWVLSAILTQFRQWPTLLRFQEQGVWAHRKFNADTIDGKRVLVVGAGSIGTMVAHRLTAFGARATLVARNARPGVYPTTELSHLIAGHQIVVITTPLTAETDAMVDSAFLAAMDDGALLVNAARGRIVDTDALVAELTRGRLLAALDVTEPEPLPKDHPLWNCPGLILSPHSARTVPGTNLLCYQVAAEQIANFVGRDSTEP